MASPCPTCLVGSPIATGVVLATTPPLHEYRCPACGRITHEPLTPPAPAPLPALPESAETLTLLRQIAGDLAAIRLALAGPRDA